jgi:hypothetical protein
MDNLKQLMIDRAATEAGHTPPPPSGDHAQRWERWGNAQQMINGYQNSWSPNPVLTQLMEKK